MRSVRRLMVEDAIARLRSWLPWQRRAAARALLAAPNARALPALVQALGDRDRRVRETAAAALKRRSGRAVGLLIEGLGDERPRVRRESAHLLGRLGSLRAVEPLFRAVGDGDREVREAAVGALGSLGDPAKEALIAALGHPGPRTRRRAEQVLDALGEGEIARAFRRALGGGPEALATLADPRIVAPLLRALGSADPELRSAAAGALPALAGLGEAGAAPLVRALRSRQPAARRGAVEGLVALGPAAVRALRAALWRGSLEARVAAAEALGRIGDARPFERTGRGPRVRDLPPTVAAVGRAYLGDARAVPALASAIEHPAREVRLAVIMALGHLGAAAAPALAPLRAALAADRPWLWSATRDRERRAAYEEAIGRIEAAVRAGPAELEAASAPGGRGTELEAAAAPEGRGTELEATRRPACSEGETSLAKNAPDGPAGERRGGWGSSEE